MRCSICGQEFGIKKDRPKWRRILEIPGAVCASCCPSGRSKKTG